jgi:serine/tyrosine/threonine adenylyltransferase
MFTLEHTFADELEGLFEPWHAAKVAEPQLVVLDTALARELGLDPEWLATPEGLAHLVGSAEDPSWKPVAQAYSGHQFGGFSPRLGDGRALLLGELVDRNGVRRDLHLKGSGRTPFSRGGDGKAALGPMLREYVMGVAMHALGVPTTRALAVVATGEPVVRDSVLPGAVLVRVASSHLRVGTFQYAALTGDRDLLDRLTRYAITRHHPQAADAEVPALALLDAVVEAQASLVAQWMLVGFVHGVMNTDNTTISGETIDYGPCAFIDRFDPATVFSSIDHGGRYAYGNQPHIVQWNLARLAETLLPLIDTDSERAVEAATAVLHGFAPRYTQHWQRGMRAKLGLVDTRPDDGALFEDLYELLRRHGLDHTSWFAAQPELIGDDVRADAIAAGGDDHASWMRRWYERLDAERRPTVEVVASTRAANPVFIPRNHLVEEALTAATNADPRPLAALVDAITRPFDRRPGMERYAAPAPSDAPRHVTFCGT